MTKANSNPFIVESWTVDLVVFQTQPAGDADNETDDAARLALNLVLGFAAGLGASWEEE